jgi:hypothetical protein
MYYCLTQCFFVLVARVFFLLLCFLVIAALLWVLSTPWIVVNRSSATDRQCQTALNRKLRSTFEKWCTRKFSRSVKAKLRINKSHKTRPACTFLFKVMFHSCDIKVCFWHKHRKQSTKQNYTKRQQRIFINIIT